MFQRASSKTSPSTITGPSGLPASRWRVSLIHDSTGLVGVNSNNQVIICDLRPVEASEKLASAPGIESPVSRQQGNTLRQVKKLKQRLMYQHLTHVEKADLLKGDIYFYDNYIREKTERHWIPDALAGFGWECEREFRTQLKMIELEKKRLDKERQQLKLVLNQERQKIGEMLHLLQVIPPALTSAHLKTLVRKAYTKLTHAIYAVTMQFKEEKFQVMKTRAELYSIGGHYFFDSGHCDLDLMKLERELQEKVEEQYCAIKNFQATIGNVISDLTRLYQWIHEEDKEMSQEAAINQLLQLLVWLSQIISYLFEDTHRGGFRNLLLDGWWLEFWEIILLAAGDVESHPGPKQITDVQLAKIDNRVLGKQDLFEVRDAVFDCRKCWFDLCLALQLTYDDLSPIRREFGGDTAACLREGLYLWLQGGGATWRVLVDAVANSSGGNDLTLALEIARKHEVIQAVKASSVPRSVHEDSTENKGSQEMSRAFSRLYRSLIGHLQRVDVNKVKDAVCYLSDPRSFSRPCVPPSVYQDAISTKDLLNRLNPEYINPGNTFLLEEIVDSCGSRRCKKLLHEYTNKYLQ